MAKKIAAAWGERSKNRDSDVTTHVAMIRIYEDAGNVIETHEHKGDFKDDHTTIDRRATPLLDEFPKPRISLVWFVGLNYPQTSDQHRKRPDL